jgi:hypothetical protein
LHGTNGSIISREPCQTIVMNLIGAVSRHDRRREREVHGADVERCGAERRALAFLRRRRKSLPFNRFKLAAALAALNRGPFRPPGRDGLARVSTAVKVTVVLVVPIPQASGWEQRSRWRISTIIPLRRDLRLCPRGSGFLQSTGPGTVGHFMLPSDYSDPGRSRIQSG